MDQEIVPILDYLTDPEGFIRAAHGKGCPFVHTDLGPVAVRHEAVRALVRTPDARPAFSRSLEQWGITSGPFHAWMSRSPLDMEDEPHKVWRRVMARTFTPHSVERLRPIIRGHAEALVRGLSQKGQCEFIADYARLLPAIGLCELIGVPLEDRSVFGDWADTLGAGFNPMLATEMIADIDAALVSLVGYARDLVDRRRAAPVDDFISHLIRAADETGTLSAEQVVDTVAALVFAGHETTKNQLGWAIVILSGHPQEWDRIAREPERAVSVVEEVLRYRSTASALARLALSDLQVMGEAMPAESRILGSLWAANMDPAEFPRPYEFAVDDNADGAHMAFGQGVHHCLGAALARLELQESLKVLTEHLQCPVLGEGITFTPPIGITGPTNLPVRFEAR